jgi:hypothetical protein
MTDEIQQLSVVGVLGSVVAQFFRQSVRRETLPRVRGGENSYSKEPLRPLGMEGGSAQRPKDSG